MAAILYEHATLEIDDVRKVALHLDAMAPKGYELIHLHPWKMTAAILIFRRPMPDKPPDAPATEEPRAASAAAIARIKAAKVGRTPAGHRNP